MQTLKYALKSFGLYVASCAADIVSSLRIHQPFQETNPFSRHVDGTFWLRHALVCDAINTSEILVLSLVAYWAAKPSGDRWAKLACGAPWLYYGFLHFDATFNNILCQWPGLYVETARGLFEKLMGQ